MVGGTEHYPISIHFPFPPSSLAPSLPPYRRSQATYHLYADHTTSHYITPHRTTPTGRSKGLASYLEAMLPRSSCRQTDST